MSHASGDLHVADVLLVQHQLGRCGTAVLCPFSVSFRGNCTLSLSAPGRLDGS